MEARSYRAILLRRWLSVLLVTALTLAVTMAVTLSLTKRYTATTQLFFGVRAGTSTTDLVQGAAFTEQQMRSYVVVAVSPLVLKRVIAEVGLKTTPQELAKSVKAEAAAGTVVLDISVSGPDPNLASRIADSIAAQLVLVAGDLSPASSRGQPAVRATVLAEAIVPPNPSSPVLSRNLVVALVIGLLLGAGVALAKEKLDTRIRSENDLRPWTGSPVLGVVAFDPHAKAALTGKSGAWAEALLRLRVSLESAADPSQVGPIVITSAIGQEGKSTTAFNLANSAAGAGLRVLLIDGDLRTSSLASSLGLTGVPGLTSLLTSRRVELASAIQRPDGSAVDVLASGPSVPNPSALLATSGMSRLMGQLSQAYDLVLIDSPPLLQVPDAVILGRLAEGTVLVVGDRLHRGQLRSALQALGAVDAKLLGIVLNKVPPRTHARLNPIMMVEWEQQTEGSRLAPTPNLSNGQG